MSEQGDGNGGPVKPEAADAEAETLAQMVSEVAPAATAAKKREPNCGPGTKKPDVCGKITGCHYTKNEECLPETHKIAIAEKEASGSGNTNDAAAPAAQESSSTTTAAAQESSSTTTAAAQESKSTTTAAAQESKSTTTAAGLGKEDGSGSNTLTRENIVPSQSVDNAVEAAASQAKANKEKQLAKLDARRGIKTVTVCVSQKFKNGKPDGDSKQTLKLDTDEKSEEAIIKELKEAASAADGANKASKPASDGANEGGGKRRTRGGRKRSDKKKKRKKTKKNDKKKKKRKTSKK